jgi:hypothetical protein
MEITAWNLYAHCRIGEATCDMIIGLIEGTVEPSTIYPNMAKKEKTNHTILYTISMMVGAEAMGHFNFGDHSYDYVDFFEEERSTIMLRNGKDWLIGIPGYYVNMPLNKNHKKVPQRKQALDL